LAGKKKRFYCDVCGSTHRVSLYKDSGMILCGKHRRQMSRHGKIFRTKYDANEIILFDNYAEVVLYNINGEEVNRTLIDLEDVEKVKQFKWHFNANNGYVESGSKGTKMLHRVIMDCPIDLTVDHISCNKLDNRKINLRICTQKENNLNKIVGKNSKSGVLGVNYADGKWRVRVHVDGKEINIGYYENLDDAKRARKDAAEKYYGEFAHKEVSNY
jgi:hypothetical protein